MVPSAGEGDRQAGLGHESLAVVGNPTTALVSATEPDAKAAFRVELSKPAGQVLHAETTRSVGCVAVEADNVNLRSSGQGRPTRL